MALDGITLGLVKKELECYLIGSKIDKVHQPSKNELVFIMRTRNGAYRLYLSCDGQSPRVHMTRYNLENPKTPPMLCMLLRKKLGGGRLKSVSQYGIDRVLMLDFDCKNELGDDVVITIIVEMLGRLSNIIFVENGKIIESVRRVDPEEGKRFIHDGQVDRGMETAAALVGADGAVILDAEAAVDVGDTIVINPGNAELNNTLRLDKTLNQAGLLPLGVLVHNQIQRFENFADSLQKFFFVCVALFYSGVDAVEIFAFIHDWIPPK